MTDIATIKRRPIRGFIWGLAFGLGLALLLIGRAVIALGTNAPYVVIVIGAILGIVWAYVAPAKGPTEPPPASTEPVTEEEPAEEAADSD
jgi:uncharacterized membrane protein YedE/YeeE